MISQNENSIILSNGWKRVEVTRKKGISAGKVDVYMYSPGGKLYRSKRELAKLIEDRNLKLNINDFNFSIVKKKVSLNTPVSPLLTPTESVTDYSESSNSLEATESMESGSTLSSSFLLDPMEGQQRQVEITTENNVSLSLLSGKWVTDDTIQVYFDLISSTMDKNSSVFLMNPVIAQASKCLEETANILTPLDLYEKSHILIPVNDADSIETSFGQGNTDDSGSHWSLLMYIKHGKRFLYFDSCGTYNYPSAKKIAEKISTCLGIEEEVVVHTCKTPQQKTSTDCGIFLILIAEVLMSHIKKLGAECIDFNLQDFSEFDIWNKRAQLASILQNRKSMYLKLGQMVSQILCKVEEGVKDYRKDQEMQKENDTKRDENVSREPLDNFTTKNYSQNILAKEGKNTKNTWQKVKKGSKKSYLKDNFQNQIPLQNKFETLSRTHNTTTSDRKTIKLDNTVKSHNTPEHIVNGKYFWKNLNVSGVRYQEGKHLIVGDSMVKYVSIPDITVKSFRGISAMQMVQKLQSITKEVETPKAVFIHVGTNDLGNMRNSDDVMGAMKNLIAKAKSAFPQSITVVSSIICRRDVPNFIRKQTNANIKWLCRDLGSIYLDLDKYIDYSCLARDGLHLNKKGICFLNRILKKVAALCGKVYNTLEKQATEIKNTSDIDDRKIKHSKIKIIDTHMANLIEKFGMDPCTAFAHCISADFENEMQMSAGMAVVFRKHFGKPKTSDCLNKQLACQELSSGPVVYSLITKGKYFQKPFGKDYDMSFKQLTEDFQRRGLKRLICSPMGCVRDRIPLHQFAENLITFQNNTGADVSVIAYNTNPEYVLKNGLTHKDFLKRLIQSVNRECIKTIKANANSLKVNTPGTKPNFSIFSSSMTDFPPMTAVSRSSNVGTHDQFIVKKPSHHTPVLEDTTTIPSSSHKYSEVLVANNNTSTVPLCVPLNQDCDSNRPPVNRDVNVKPPVPSLNLIVGPPPNLK